MPWAPWSSSQGLTEKQGVRLTPGMNTQPGIDPETQNMGQTAGPQGGGRGWAEINKALVCICA